MGLDGEGTTNLTGVQTPATDGPIDDVREGAADDLGDELPEELQPALATGPYVFPNNSRRRIPGVLYLVLAAGLVALWALLRPSAAVNGGLLFGAVLLALAGLYAILAGADLAVDERDALILAGADLGVVVGYASAQLGWRGLLSRPTWRILLYSAEQPPTTRALVFVDGIDGRIVDKIVEDNPEDWSELTGENAAN